MRKERLWWIWSAVGALAIGGYFLLPRGSLNTNALYNIVGLVSAVLIVVGARIHRPAKAQLWYLFAAGQILWVIGDLIYAVYLYGLDLEPYPSIADAFYLAAYPLLIGGLVKLVRGRSRHDTASLIDASIIATGLGLVFWVFIMRPIAGDTEVPNLERLISLAYPFADVLLLAILARLFTGGGARTASFKLLTASVLLLLCSDIGFSIVTTYSGYDGGVLDAGWLLSYVGWAAAALHPSMRAMTQAPSARRPGRIGRGRLTLLA